MGTRKAKLGAIASLLLMLSLCSSDAVSAPVDGAARGLDAFIELPTSAVSGAKLAIDLRTFGFKTAVDPAPIAGVKVEAVWEGSDDPPTTLVTDNQGLGTLSLTMPDGPKESASLMLALSFGEHRRTKTVHVERAPTSLLDLRVDSQSVAPGSRIPAWIWVRDPSTGAPRANVEVLMKLTEGGYVRQTISLRSDASGAASALVSVPAVDEPTFGWSLSVESVKEHSNGSHIDLYPREDLPAEPTLSASFEASRLLPGEKTVVHVRLTDASGNGVARGPVQYQFADGGSDSTKSFSLWEKEAKTVVTDEMGDATIPYAAPSVGFATKKHVNIHAVIDGRERETSSGLVIVAKVAPSIELTPEAGAVVPGVEQRLLLRARDGWDKPMQGAELKVEGDGLTSTVKTDARGLVELVWKAPKDVGANRKVGPCSGGVATTIHVTALGNAAPELLRAGSVAKCLTVDRTAKAILKPAALVVRSQASVGLELALAEGAPAKGPVSVSMSGGFGNSASLEWLTAPNGETQVPISAGGVLVMGAESPRADGASVHASSAVVVKPRVLPKLTAQKVGGRSTPGGVVDIDARLVDETGAPLQGAVTAIVTDKSASSEYGLAGFDTRLGICKEANVEAADCDAILSGDPAVMPLLRASLSRVTGGGIVVAGDPGGSAKEEMRQTFNTVLKNLEGAVFESSSSVESLRDVRRVAGGKNELNPEILTLVTAALDTPPTTPGGEPFTLGDLRALDPQVDYDTVARRVTRLKMFRILAAVRTFRNAQDLDANEPVLQDPNAILRRLFDVESGDDQVNQSSLLDAWGGSMQFVKAGGAGLPFINALPGWELHAPGPDGRIGTADDVKDPFARVVKSGSPYARAMGEDKIVDARLDMRVGEETVSKWTSLLTEFTGTELSNGSGFGSGHGRLGGSHTTRAPSIRMGATRVTRDRSALVVSVPVRTDKDGVAHLHVTLGDDETTYRILLLASPDTAGPAAGSLDVPTALPLSVRVDGGTKWTRGDSLTLPVRVENHTSSALVTKMHLSASGAADLGPGQATDRTITVGARASVTIPIAIRAAREGEAQVGVSIAGGSFADSVEHRIEVGPNGRRMTLAKARWVSSDVLIDTFHNDDITTLEGSPSLLLEGNFDATLSAVMDSLRADRLSSSDSATDAIEVFERLRRDWQKREPTLAARAETMRAEAQGRFYALYDSEGGEHRDTSQLRRARLWGGGSEAEAQKHSDEVSECPAEKPQSSRERVRDVEGEPPPVAGNVAACWDASISEALRAAKDARDPVLLARLLLAFAERSHRSSLASEIAPELATLVALKPTGEMSLTGALEHDRSSRAIVYAALVRATALDFKPVAKADTLVGWLLVQRTPDGRFGSASATRAAVQALDALGSKRSERRVLVTELDREGDVIGKAREITLTGSTRIPIDPKARHVGIVVVPPPGSKPDVVGPGFLVRLEQSALRSFSFQPGPADLSNALSVDVKWPANASLDRSSSLEVRFVHKTPGVHKLMARIPLVPGARLAEPVTGVKQINGALLLTSDLEDDTSPNLPTLIPLRFTLGGEMTAAEVTVRDASDDSARARSLANRVKVSASIGAPP